MNDAPTTTAPASRLLLHVCCAPCSTTAIERLRDRYAVTGFFSNSNIAPEPEYWRRLREAQRLAAAMQIPCVLDTYDHAAWLACIEGYEDAAEGGARCKCCFAFNLSRTAAYARREGFALYTTTLSISPHKSSVTLFRVGRELGPFLDVDFKKQDGFRRSLALSRQYNLYRQDYCGCEFSLAARRHYPQDHPDRM